MSADDSWTLPACPTCRGKGERVMVGRSWISVMCEDCRGSGVVRPARPMIAAAVIVDAAGVLLVRRTNAEPELEWQFPAGEVEPGETVAAAAVREANEETGLRVAATAELGERVHPVTGRTVAYLACTVREGEACMASRREVAEIRWCGLAELPEFVGCGLYRPVQAHLEALLSRDG